MGLFGIVCKPKKYKEGNKSNVNNNYSDLARWDLCRNIAQGSQEAQASQERANGLSLKQAMHAVALFWFGALIIS
jgi:hypothetical protein